MTIARLMGAEIGMIIVMSGMLCLLLVLGVNLFTNDLVRMMFIR